MFETFSLANVLLKVLLLGSVGMLPAASLSVIGGSPSATIISPVEGASLQRGDIPGIHWQIPGLREDTTVNISLISTQTNSITQIASDIHAKTDTHNPNRGLYNWNVPMNLALGKYRVRIQCQSGQSCDTTSGTFSVIQEASNAAAAYNPNAPALTLVDGGSINPDYRPGDWIRVVWNAAGMEGTTVDATLVNADTDMPVGTVLSNIRAKMLENKGWAFWTVPASLPLGNYKLRISCSIPSSKPCSIDTPAFKVVAALTPRISFGTQTEPATYSVGTRVTINWIRYNFVQGDIIRISLINPETKAVVAQVGTSQVMRPVSGANRYFYWTVPTSIPTGTYKFKLQCLPSNREAARTCSAETQSTFQITGNTTGGSPAPSGTTNTQGTTSTTTTR